MTDKPKFCKDCAHYKKGMNSEFDKCLYGKQEYSAIEYVRGVTGDYYTSTYCKDERCDCGSCTKLGKHFQPKRGVWETIKHILCDYELSKHT